MIFPQEDDVTEVIIKPFKTVPDSMFVLFRVMSGSNSEDETLAIDQLMLKFPSMKFAFVFFMVTSSWTLLSILTAVVSENMITTTSAQQHEYEFASAEDDRNQHIKELKELFAEIDTGDGLVQEEDFKEFLKNKSNALKTARKCRVPVHDVLEVLKTLSMNGA